MPKRGHKTAAYYRRSPIIPVAMALADDLMCGMRQGTPEQNEEVRHRRKVFQIISLLPLLCFISIVAFHKLLLDEKLWPILAIGGFFLLMGLLVFVTAYYRCPVCKQTFGRGVTERGGKHCENCDTVFDPQPES